MFSNGQCSLKFRKRDKLWKNSTGTCKLSMHDKKNLDLTSGWWKPVPNTAVKAFTITGDID